MPKRPQMSDEEHRRWTRKLREDMAWSEFEHQCWLLDHPIILRCRATGRLLAVIPEGAWT